MSNKKFKVKIGIDASHAVNTLKNHLFSETDVFLRELVANSIDAVKARSEKDVSFKMQTEANIRIYADRKKRTLSIVDNGIGMTKDEARESLGNLFQTSKIGGGFIGMFGIGFYSCLKVAEKVEVWTRSAAQPNGGCKLLFDDSGTIQGWETPREEIGTEVKVSLKEEFYLEYTNLDIIEHILLKYLRFSPCPIYLGNFPEPICQEEPLYLQQAQYITDQQWKEFLIQHLPHAEFITYYPLTDTDTVKGVLMVPRLRSKGQDSFNLHLYVNHIFIKDKATELVSMPFRPFIGGIIDVENLPISLNRKEELEDTPEIKDLRKTLDNSVILWLSHCAEKRRETFEEVMKYHDRSIKRACIEFDSLLQHLYPHLQFQSSYKSNTTLNEYLKRRGSDHQQHIFYLTNQNEQGPLLNIYNQKGIEVIFFETPEDLKLFQQFERFYPDQQFVRIDKYHLKDTGDKDAIFRPTDDKRLEEQLIQVFHRFVDEELKVQLTRIPNRNLPSLILKDQDDQHDDLYRMLANVVLSGKEDSLPPGVRKDDIYEETLNYIKDQMGPKVLLLNETNPAVQRLESLLNHKNLGAVEDPLSLMAKALYFMALTYSQEELTQEQLEEYTFISSKILDGFGSLLLNRQRGGDDSTEKVQTLKELEKEPKKLKEKIEKGDTVIKKKTHERIGYRKATVAGAFYEGDGSRLQKQLKECFSGISIEEKENVLGAVVPHSGYMYSGSVAASAYAKLPRADTFVILGPNHQGIGSLIAVSEDTWVTPLGEVEVDKSFVDALPKRIIDVDETAHKYEHSIEVQLPFLQFLFDKNFQFVPICMSLSDEDTAREIGEDLANTIAKFEKKVVVIASSDFTHYEPD
ncbi:MAG: AmmeMemoRadiSam system protein B, partial [Thermoplasmatales archaeon]|nr:AmmeMemoRadiSam system protein B [Thermoplasmatales archaeon]